MRSGASSLMMSIIPEVERTAPDSIKQQQQQTRHGHQQHQHEQGGDGGMGQQWQPTETSAVHLITKQELGITRAQASLAEEAKARQREFDEQVHHLNARVAALEEKIRRVAHDREAAVPQLQARLSARCAEVESVWGARIEGAFEGLLQEALPPVAARAVEAEDEARHFLQAVAPPLVHTATGEVAEAHRQALEALSLERTKAQKREERIAARLEGHLKETAKGFEAETGTRIETLRALEEAVRAPGPMLEEEDASYQGQVKGELRGLHDALAGEAQAREEADCVVLDAMLEAQRRLQQIILDNFGAGAGAETHHYSYSSSYSYGGYDCAASPYAAYAAAAPSYTQHEEYSSHTSSAYATYPPPPVSAAEEQQQQVQPPSFVEQQPPPQEGVYGWTAPATGGGGGGFGV